MDEAQAALWSQNYPVSRAQEWQHIMANVQRFAHSDTNPSEPWTAADVEYQLTPVWAIDYAGWRHLTISIVQGPPLQNLLQPSSIIYFE